MNSVPTHTPFLQQVANYYAHQNLENYCFIFPNRRSGQFFLKHLRQAGESCYLQPQVTTITDFVVDNSEADLASPIELIFNLYQAFQEVSHNPDYQFDKFIHWGNILLSDFNDVDQYLVDPKEIFKNITAIKEISTDYLSPELKKELNKYFNIRFEDSDPDRFWKYNNDTNDNTTRKFKHLWSLLYDLYATFQKRLNTKGISYIGKMQRDFAEQLNNTDQTHWAFERYVFIGFSLLSTAELKIFEAFQKAGIADFFWDNASPAFSDSTNIGHKHIKYLAQKFKSPIEIDAIEEFPPHIHVAGISSNVGQAKYAFNLVKSLLNDNLASHDKKALDTAIVLPDENLFPLLTASVPGGITNVNATLGATLRNSDIASLIRIISKVHKNAYKAANDECYKYYKEFVNDIISHPIIKSVYPKAVAEIGKRLSQIQGSYIKETDFAGTELNEIFTTITNTTSEDDVIAFIHRLINLLKKIIQFNNPSSSNDDNETDEQSAPTLQSCFCYQYIDILSDTESIIQEYGIPMCDSTVFYLFDKITSLYVIPFEGEPLSGIQIMGMLETRNLDFKNLIILSMNERVFPRKHFKNSFIPPNIRRWCFMSTIDEQEAMSAYYFYRLIARAENVYMLYTTNTAKIGSNEYSRFISQLHLVYGCKINFRQVILPVSPVNTPTITIPKTPKIMERLNRYLADDDTKLTLSASALKGFIVCPLQFYFKYIERLPDEREKSEYMDYATFGSIVHDSLQDLYYPEEIKNKGEHNRVYKHDIVDFRKNQLDKVLIKHINTDYLRKDDPQAPLFGETDITFEALKYYAMEVLNYDIKLLKHKGDFFEIYECEVPKKVKIQVGDKCINFKYIIDRLDRINNEGPLRIIDYKTGKDDVDFKKMNNLFVETAKDRLAIMQLFLYCNAYHAEGHDVSMGLTPMIYKIKDMKTSGIKYNQKLVENLKIDDPLNQEYMRELEALINDLFNPEVPFTQCKSTKPCEYCGFKDFCRR